MTNLGGTVGRDRPRPVLYAGAAVFTVGLLFVGIGSLSVAYDAFSATMAPGDAALSAATVAGLAVPAVLATLIVALGGRADRRLVGGLAVSSAGVALVWVLVPAGWTGGLTVTLAPAALVYVAGLLALQATFFGVALGRRRSASAQPAPGRIGTADSDPRAAVGDGGEDDDRLTFLRDEDDDTD